MIYINNEVYPIVQINGQRITGPSNNFNINPPDESLEIFVNNIPRNVYESTLLPIFANIGPIYKFRLMMNFSGMNRGFGYLQYTNEMDTRRALHCLRNVEIGTHKLSVYPSKNNSKLILGKIDLTFNDEAIGQFILNLTNAKMVTVLSTGQHKYAIITYNTHRDAALARRALVCEVQRFGRECWLRWNKEGKNHTQFVK